MSREKTHPLSRHTDQTGHSGQTGGLTSGGFMPDAEIRSHVGRCAKCGACRAHCPVFEALPDEPAAPRGKIQLLGHLRQGLEPTERLREIFARCLLCKTCVSGCPNGVPVDALVLEARSRIASALGIDSGVRLGLRGLLSHPRRLGWAARTLGSLRRMGIDRLAARWSPAVNRALGLVPRLRRRPLLESVPRRLTVAAPRARVAYFPGCLNNHLADGSGEAVLEILLHLGVEVWLPDQGCCGLPALAQGDLSAAGAMAELNVGGLTSALKDGCDLILVDCGSCGTTLREYGAYGFGAGAALTELRNRVRDVYTFILELGVDPGRLGPPQSGLRVTYHDPCHLRRGMGVYREPRELLGLIPDLELSEMDGADRCCGGAGSFMLTHDSLSAAIAGPKARAIAATGASLAVTSCGACAVQLECRLREAGLEPAVLAAPNLLREAFRAGRCSGTSGNKIPVFSKTS